MRIRTKFFHEVRHFGVLKSREIADEEGIVDIVLFKIQFHRISVNSKHVQNPLGIPFTEQLCRPHVYKEGTMSGEGIAQQ